MDTPWIKTTTNSPVANATFEGALIDYEISESLLVTGLYVGAYKGVAQSKFTSNTMYTLIENSVIPHPDPGIGALDLTLGLGAQYEPNDTSYAQIWGYAFKGYVSMLYVDGGKKFEINENHSFTLDLQGSLQSDLLVGESITSKLDLGAPNSTMLGARLTYSNDLLDIGLGANALLGPANSFQQGGMISPYTFEIANDPLYTTSFQSGMVEKGGGYAVKAFSKGYINDKISVAPSIALYDNRDGITSFEFNTIAAYYFDDPGIQLDFVYALSGNNNLNGTNNMVQARASFAF